MGRLTTPSPENLPARAALNYFSHPHPLLPTPSLHIQLCAACNQQSTTTMYSCLPCSFSLHQSCATLPRHITHPSHGGCTLALLTSPSYGASAFSCDACKRSGLAWSYHCTGCEYDLHVACASKPITTRHPALPSCDLHLTFKSPYANSDGFSCDICRRIRNNQWLYRCNSCEFDVHLECIARTPPPQTQTQTPHQVPHQTLYPPAPPPAPLYQNPQFVHGVSTGYPQMNPVNQRQIC